MSKKEKKKSGKGAGVDLIDRHEDKQRIQPPSKYQIVFDNDDYTPMGFVAAILMSVFHRDFKAAWDVTLDIHEKGKGIAGGPYTKEIAETKMLTTNDTARISGHPLLARMEKAE